MVGSDDRWEKWGQREVRAVARCTYLYETPLGTFFGDAASPQIVPPGPARAARDAPPGRGA